jgi:hypothetical protein
MFAAIFANSTALPSQPDQIEVSLAVFAQGELGSPEVATDDVADAEDGEVEAGAVAGVGETLLGGVGVVVCAIAVSSSGIGWTAAAATTTARAAKTWMALRDRNPASER